MDVIYTCPFIPEEWIAAHGLRPCRIAPRGTNGVPAPGTGMGMCPFARAFLHEAGAREGAAVVFTTVCDQMRRVSELVAGDRETVFLMHVPATWQTPGVRAYYRAELERLGRFLERIGGRRPAPEQLATVMAEHDAARAELRAAVIKRAAKSSHGVRLAVVGGPAPSAFFDAVESAGGTVVLDATETGERTLPAPFDPATLELSPLDALVEAYFGHIPDAFRRPNDGLYAWLARELAARDVRGIVFRRYLWCDTWHAEAGRMGEWSAAPVLALDVDGDDALHDRLAWRIRAFVEALA